MDIKIWQNKKAWQIPLCVFAFFLCLLLYCFYSFPEAPQLEKFFVPVKEVTLVEFKYPKGTVERIEEGKIVIRADTGLLELLVNEDTDVSFHAESLYELLHGEAASLEDIKVGDEIGTTVKVYSDQTVKAVYIQIL